GNVKQKNFLQISKKEQVEGLILKHEKEEHTIVHNLWMLIKGRDTTTITKKSHVILDNEKPPKLYSFFSHHLFNWKT
ncbi:hypothetical protein ACJX0J_029065, partial [Zea mays]